MVDNLVDKFKPKFKFKPKSSLPISSIQISFIFIFSYIDIFEKIYLSTIEVENLNKKTNLDLYCYDNIIK